MILKIRHGENFYLRDLKEVRENRVSEKWLHDQLVTMYYNALTTLKVEPFKIMYGRGRGYCLVASSYVGVIRSDQITLWIESSIPGLDFAKILYLSTVADVQQKQDGSGKIIDTAIVEEQEMEAVDYYIISFLEALDQISRTGVIQIQSETRDVLHIPKGRIDLSEQIRKSPAFDRFHVRRNIYSSDVVINQILLRAIQISQQRTKFSWVIPLLEDYQRMFDGVSEKEIEKIDFVRLLEEYTTLTRKDYEKALLLAEHIIFGYGPVYGSGFELLPEYLINLNDLFESYTIQSLRGVFTGGLSAKYKLSLGIKPFDPPLEKRYLELDGFYCGTASVVIDAKNKFNEEIKENEFLPQNQDIYQQYFYACRTGSKHVVLVYPSIKKQNRPISSFHVGFAQGQEVHFHCWALWITGNPRENRKAVIHLAKFIDELSN